MTQGSRAAVAAPVAPILGKALDAVEIGSVSLPIAVGLLAMMYPVLAKVTGSRNR